MGLSPDTARPGASTQSPGPPGCLFPPGLKRVPGPEEVAFPKPLPHLKELRVSLPSAPDVFLSGSCEQRLKGAGGSRTAWGQRGSYCCLPSAPAGGAARLRRRAHRVPGGPSGSALTAPTSLDSLHFRLTTAPCTPELLVLHGTCTHVWTHTSMDTHVCTQVWIHIHTVNKRGHRHTSVGTHVWTCEHMHMCGYTRVWTHTQAGCTHAWTRTQAWIRRCGHF